MSTPLLEGGGVIKVKPKIRVVMLEREGREVRKEEKKPIEKFSFD